MKYAITLVCCAAVSGVLLSQNHLLRQDNIFLNASNRLLQDERWDLSYALQQASARTYEDGYRDAIIRSGDNSGTYADGFLAAKLKYENKSYTEGYHSAVDQFGAVWSDNKEKPKRIEQIEPEVKDPLPPKKALSQK